VTDASGAANLERLDSRRVGVSVAASETAPDVSVWGRATDTAGGRETTANDERAVLVETPVSWAVVNDDGAEAVSDESVELCVFRLA
jgi:hypothetical protein